MTARPSTENNSKPSSSPPRTWSMFSRKLLKISRTPRSCIPIWLIFVLTWPNSSPRSSGFWSNSPLEMRSSCAVMRLNGAREMLLTSAASKTEIPTEASASSAAERSAGVIFARNRPGLHRDANDSKRNLVARRAQLEWVSHFVSARRSVDQAVKFPQLFTNPCETSCASFVPAGIGIAGQRIVAGDQHVPCTSEMETS